MFCTTCNSDWSAGSFDPACPECGGGAMQHDCLVCGGKCGAKWTRTVQDSHDQKLAHWFGKCLLLDS